MKLTFGGLLSKAQLTNYREGLARLGVTTIENLKDLDLKEIGFWFPCSCSGIGLSIPCQQLLYKAFLSHDKGFAVFHFRSNFKA